MKGDETSVLPGVQRLVRSESSLTDLIMLYWSTPNLAVCRGILRAVAMLEGVATRGLGDQRDRQLAFLISVGECDGLESSQELKGLARTLIVRNLLPRVKSGDAKLICDVLRFFGRKQNCSGLSTQDVTEGLWGFLDRCGVEIAGICPLIIPSLNKMVVNTRYFTRVGLHKYTVHIGIVADVYRDCLGGPKALPVPVLQWAGWRKIVWVERAQCKLQDTLAAEDQWAELQRCVSPPIKVVEMIAAQNAEQLALFQKDLELMVKACIRIAQASDVVSFVLQCVHTLQVCEKAAVAYRR